MYPQFLLAKAGSSWQECGCDCRSRTFEKFWRKCDAAAFGRREGIVSALWLRWVGSTPGPRRQRFQNSICKKVAGLSKFSRKVLNCRHSVVKSPQQLRQDAMSERSVFPGFRGTREATVVQVPFQFGCGRCATLHCLTGRLSLAHPCLRLCVLYIPVSLS